MHRYCACGYEQSRRGAILTYKHAMVTEVTRRYAHAECDAIPGFCAPVEINMAIASISIRIADGHDRLALISPMAGGRQHTTETAEAKSLLSCCPPNTADVC